MSDWPDHRGIGGRIIVEQVAECSWNRWPNARGKHSRDIVLDLFGGSGTTLIAAERTGRSARLMELDPKYVDVIVQRWQGYSGNKAVLDGEDRTYEDLRSARSKKGSNTPSGVGA